MGITNLDGAPGMHVAYPQYRGTQDRRRREKRTASKSGLPVWSRGPARAYIQGLWALGFDEDGYD